MDDQGKEHKEQYFTVACNISYHVMVFLAAAKQIKAVPTTKAVFFKAAITDLLS